MMIIVIIYFFKLDGIPAILKFYDEHFVVTNDMKLELFPHVLPKDVTHRLKDFSFVVETELYESMFKSIFINKPNPMAIIDLNNDNNNFSAIDRMDIIQNLRKLYADTLKNYFIFFQGQSINDNNNIITYPKKEMSSTKSKMLVEKKYFILFAKQNNNNTSNNNALRLNHGNIYEVSMNDKYEIVKLVKERPDKLYPNSRKNVETIIKILNLQKF